MNLITRQEAKAAGLAMYFTGKPCNLGGVAERTVSEKKCQCEAHKSKRSECAAKRYERNKEKILAAAKEWAAKHQEEQKAYRRKHYKENKHQYLERAKAWASENVEKVRETARNWAKRHRDRALAQVHDRLARKRSATAGWDKELTRLVVIEAADVAKRRFTATGFKWDIDHIIPMRGKLVSGLHVWNNIQVIPMALNRRKSNKFTMEAA